jgi:Putative Ig domain
MSQGGKAPTGFTAMAPPDTTAGSLYSYRFSANGSPGPQYAVATGKLPDGLVLGSDGILEGRATTAGSVATFSVRATNQAGSVVTPDITFHVN